LTADIERIETDSNVEQVHIQVFNDLGNVLVQRRARRMESEIREELIELVYDGFILDSEGVESVKDCVRRVVPRYADDWGWKDDGDGFSWWATILAVTVVGRLELTLAEMVA